ncbi:hypothetical protein [Clostridium sp. BJN0001]|uniref:hypothetical protein n=1 Tax=Clostridium sp. BJN0001 TaxID=2930219 RepID=UPI001FD6185E|nr:hypothetical protein [Clostridium sp. BJN0001]
MDLVKFSDTVYVSDEKFVPYKNENLVVGNINEINKSSNSAILNFNLQNIEIENIKALYFYIYLQSISIYLSPKADINIIIQKYIDSEYEDLSSTILSIPVSTRKKYIKIDLKNLIDINDNKNLQYKIIIRSGMENLRLRFSSNSSKNPPYLEAFFKDADKKNMDNEKKIKAADKDEYIELKELLKKNIEKTEKLEASSKEIEKKLEELNLEIHSKMDDKFYEELKENIKKISDKLNIITIEPLE